MIRYTVVSTKKSFFYVSKAMAYIMDYGTEYSFVYLIHTIDNFS